MNSDTRARLQRWAAQVEGTLDALLPPADTRPERLHAAMRYSALGGGKRLRPLLVYACGHALSNDARGSDEGALHHAAAAVELIHAYSLIHDDLPAMDDDALRRGRPTVHIAFDEATAILAGDALQTLAFAALIQAPLPAERQLRMLRALIHASGSAGMVGGQALDLAAVGSCIDEPALIEMHARKTGALIVACGELACAARTVTDDEERAIGDFTRALGLAFQIRDDLLDVEASTEQLGKTAGKDAADAKPTYVSMLGIQGARARLAEQAQRMQLALAELRGDTAPLQALAVLTVQRVH